MTAKSNAQRQAEYRRRRPFASENGERRLTTWLTTGSALALRRMARHHGVTQRAMLEQIISAADNQIEKTLQGNAEALSRYIEN
jgi:hypothetical protein